MEREREREGGEKKKDKKTKEREANVAGNILVVDVLDEENKFILNN